MTNFVEITTKGDSNIGNHLHWKVYAGRCDCSRIPTDNLDGNPLDEACNFPLVPSMRWYAFSELLQKPQGAWSKNTCCLDSHQLEVVPVHKAWVSIALATLRTCSGDPGSKAAPMTEVSLKLSTHVASQHKLVPLQWGNTFTPSGRLPSPLPRPTGSGHDGTPAAARPRFTTSFRFAWGERLPVWGWYKYKQY